AVVATIPVGSAPSAIAVNPTMPRAYVANLNGDTLSVIDTNSNAVVATISMPVGPSGVAVTPDGSHVYVTIAGPDAFSRPGGRDNRLAIVDAATNAITATLTVGTWPFSAAISADGARAYVTNRVSGSVSVLDT